MVKKEEGQVNVNHVKCMKAYQLTIRKLGKEAATADEEREKVLY